MSVYVENVGSQKIKYPEHKDVEFYSLEEYLTLAKKSISKFANSFYGGLASKMLLDEDAISNIAYSIMMADWRYDENYEGQHSKQKTRYSYRNQCALWAIQSYITKNYKKSKKNRKIYSLDRCMDEDAGTNYYSYIDDKDSADPADIVMNNEEKNTIKKYVDKLLNNNSVSDKQREYIRMYYYQGMTFEQIGREYSLTREAVRQSIKKAISYIKEATTNESVY